MAERKREGGTKPPASEATGYPRTQAKSKKDTACATTERKNKRRLLKADRSPRIATGKPDRRKGETGAKRGLRGRKQAPLEAVAQTRLKDAKAPPERHPRTSKNRHSMKTN